MTANLTPNTPGPTRYNVNDAATKKKIHVDEVVHSASYRWFICGKKGAVYDAEVPFWSTSSANRS